MGELFHPSLNLNRRLLCVSSDCKYLYVGGHIDNSIKIYTLPKLRLLSSTVQHIDIVTCLSLDEGGSQLISGSLDTTCIVWNISNGLFSAYSNSYMKSIQVLYGHDKPVSCVGLSMSLDMAVSGSLDGTVNIHTIKEGQYIRTLEPPGVDRIITQLSLSYQGHVIFTAEEKGNFSIHAYTINGVEVGLSFSPFSFAALTTADEYVITADSSGEVSIRKVLGLVPQENISMHTPIEDLIVTPRNTQILVALRDGKVVVIGPSVILGQTNPSRI